MFTAAFRAQFRLQSKELISQISFACILLVISTKQNGKIPLAKAVSPPHGLPAAPDSSLTPVFDTTSVAITCWQTRQNADPYFAVTPLFDTTPAQRVKISLRWPCLSSAGGRSCPSALATRRACSAGRLAWSGGRIAA